MKQLFAIVDIPYCYLRLNFETYYDKSTIGGPLNAAHLGFAFGLLFGLELDNLLVFRGDSFSPLLRVLLDEDEVIFEIGVVELPEMRELVDIRVHSLVIVLVLIETKASHYLFSHEIHDQDVCILAPNGYQSPLRIEISHLCIDPRHDHGGVIGEDDLVLL
jgi:hypothetical protein